MGTYERRLERATVGVEGPVLHDRRQDLWVIERGQNDVGCPNYGGRAYDNQFIPAWGSFPLNFQSNLQ
jgi:hypothetical protein